MRVLAAIGSGLWAECLVSAIGGTPALTGAYNMWDRDFTNPMGNVHCGFGAAMLDDTLGPARATTFAENEFAPTLELKVSCIRPGKPGRVIGTGRVVHRGGSVAFLEGELRSTGDEALATARATARLIDVGLSGFEL